MYRAPPNLQLGTLYNQLAANNSHTPAHTHTHIKHTLPPQPTEDQDLEGQRKGVYK